MKKLYRSEHDQILAGVIGGIGEYFDVDPTILRIGYVVLDLMTGVFPGIIAYIIAFFIIPERPHTVSTIVTPPPMKTEEEKPVNLLHTTETTVEQTSTTPHTPEPITEQTEEKTDTQSL
jgi:phage shock protein C